MHLYIADHWEFGEQNHNQGSSVQINIKKIFKPGTDKGYNQA